MENLDENLSLNTDIGAGDTNENSSFKRCKVHKPGFPVRPIISAPDCLGRKASKWLLRKLEIIASSFKNIKIYSANELFSSVVYKQLPPSHRLVTWDYVSMFTNIPFEFAKSIIREF